MYELKIISNFAAAHQLRGIQGACENLHGHNWQVDVYVVGQELGKDGMLVDFRVIKEATNKILSDLDHRFLNEMEAFKDANPSSENIARYIYEALATELRSHHVRVRKVTAWESESACASYMQS